MEARSKDQSQPYPLTNGGSENRQARDLLDPTSRYKNLFFSFITDVTQDWVTDGGGGQKKFNLPVVINAIVP